MDFLQLQCDRNQIKHPFPLNHDRPCSSISDRQNNEEARIEGRSYWPIMNDCSWLLFLYLF